MQNTERFDIWGTLPEELEAWVEARGESRFRARQLLDATYRHGAGELDAIAVLPKATRAAWAECLSLGLPQVAQESGGPQTGARKSLLELADGQNIEMVRIYASYGDTLCVSSQAGCALGCKFCATGLLGLRRNLTAGEIVSQVVLEARRESLPDHLVFMGMGEPLQNYDAVLHALRILTHPTALGMSARRITVSTAGMVPEIHRLAREGLAVTLAISLGGSTQEMRSRLIPLGLVYPLDSIVAAGGLYAATSGRRVSYEYLLLDGLTDRRRDAERLAALLAGQLCHVNLLHYNAIPSLPFAPSSRHAEQSFRERLEKAGVPTSIRKSKGERIMAACGQLSLRRSPQPAVPAWETATAAV